MDEVREEPFLMPPQTRCPMCDVLIPDVFLAHAGNPLRDHQQGPRPGDLIICCDCDTVIKVTEKGLVVFVDWDQISPIQRRMLDEALAILKEGKGQNQSWSGKH